MRNLNVHAYWYFFLERLMSWNNGGHLDVSSLRLTNTIICVLNKATGFALNSTRRSRPKNKHTIKLFPAKQYITGLAIISHVHPYRYNVYIFTHKSKHICDKNMQLTTGYFASQNTDSYTSWCISLIRYNTLLYRYYLCITYTYGKNSNLFANMTYDMILHIRIYIW